MTATKKPYIPKHLRPMKVTEEGFVGCRPSNRRRHVSDCTNCDFRGERIDAFHMICKYPKVQGPYAPLPPVSEIKMFKKAKADKEGIK